MPKRIHSRYGVPTGGPQWEKWERDYAKRKANEAVLHHGAERCLSHTSDIVTTDIEPTKYTDMWYLLCTMIQFKALCVYRTLRVEPDQDKIEYLEW